MCERNTVLNKRLYISDVSHALQTYTTASFLVIIKCMQKSHSQNYVVVEEIWHFYEMYATPYEGIYIW